MATVNNTAVKMGILIVSDVIVFGYILNIEIFGSHGNCIFKFLGNYTWVCIIAVKFSFSPRLFRV